MQTEEKETLIENIEHEVRENRDEREERRSRFDRSERTVRGHHWSKPTAPIGMSVQNVVLVKFMRNNNAQIEEFNEDDAIVQIGGVLDIQENHALIRASIYWRNV